MREISVIHHGDKMPIKLQAVNGEMANHVRLSRNTLAYSRVLSSRSPSGTPTCSVQIDALEQEGKFRSFELQDFRPTAILLPWDVKASLLEALRDETVSRAIPEENLDDVSSLVEENKEMSAQGIAAEEASCGSCQAIEGFSHVDGVTADQNPDDRRQSKHHEPFSRS